MPRLRRRNPLRKPRSSTAVSYIIDGRSGLFYCVVYDLRLAEQLTYMGRSLEPALLGALSVSSNDSMKSSPMCSVDFAAARQGYGPLLYDLTARGLDKYVKGCDALLASKTQTAFAKGLWTRLKSESLFPVPDSVFLQKYGMSASAMEKNGRKMSRSIKLSPANVRMEQAAYEMFDKYVAIGGLRKVRRIPLSDLLASAGYVQ